MVLCDFQKLGAKFLLVVGSGLTGFSVQVRTHAQKYFLKLAKIRSGARNGQVSTRGRARRVGGESLTHRENPRIVKRLFEGCPDQLQSDVSGDFKHNCRKAPCCVPVYQMEPVRTTDRTGGVF